MKATTSVSSLPQELLTMVIARADPNPIELIQLRQVNRQWHEAASADNLWSKYSPQAISDGRPLAEAFIERRVCGRLFQNERLRGIYVDKSKE
jgi:hypothetical protein